MTPSAEPTQPSSLRVYVGKNRVPIAVLLALLGLGGGSVPLAGRLVSGVAAAESIHAEVAVLKQEVTDLQAAQAALQDTQRRQANTQDRIDSNVMTICRALKVDCAQRPARPE